MSEVENSDKLVRARLTLDVVFQPNGTPVETLLANLRRIPELAAGEGLMSGSTEAYVESWEAEVEELPDSEEWFVTEILLHDVEWRIDGDGAPSLLSHSDVDHIESRIMDGYREGELVVTGSFDQTFRGWWRIKK